VALAASLQMLATLPPSQPRHGARAPWLEFDQTHNPFRQAIVKTPFRHRGGIVAITSGPGLGIEIDREALARFAAEV
jgi:D-galactarolactone cycloisomerase